MNEIPQNTPPHYESDVDELMRIAAEHLAGDFTTRVHYLFARPDLTDCAEVQIYVGFGYPDEARANLRAEFKAGRECMAASFMLNCEVPLCIFAFPAYRTALNVKRKRQSAGGDGK
jgi:hypothetical protein